MSDTKLQPSPNEVYAKGYLDGVLNCAWTCGDCGNTYDPTVESCPNVLLDLAHLNQRAAERESAKK